MLEQVDQLERRRIPQVVRVGLEGQPEDADRLPLQGAQLCP